MEGPLGDHGVVMDFDDLSTVVEREVVEPWDHQLLNDLIENPTAELLRRGMSEADVRKVLGENLLRVLEETTPRP